MSNLELFDRPTTGRAAARQRAMEDARARAELGMHRAATKAEHGNAGWCGMALHKLRELAKAMPTGALWTIEAAREVIEAEPALPRATDGRAWGAVVVQAIRHGYIVKTKSTAPAASSNGAPKPLFSRGPNA